MRPQQAERLSMDDLCTWANNDSVGYDGNLYIVINKCVNFKRDLWFELGKFMWKKHRSVYQDQLK